jgi:hypothetical protein
MGTINAAWHRAHPMPKNPTLEQRVQWHLAHAAACSCRELPESMLREFEARGIKPPRPPRKRRQPGA